jgi:hypothetical protein
MFASILAQWVPVYWLWAVVPAAIYIMPFWLGQISGGLIARCIFRRSVHWIAFAITAPCVAIGAWAASATHHHLSGIIFVMFAMGLMPFVLVSFFGFGRQTASARSILCGLFGSMSGIVGVTVSIFFVRWEWVVPGNPEMGYPPSLKYPCGFPVPYIVAYHDSMRHDINGWLYALDVLLMALFSVGCLPN